MPKAGGETLGILSECLTLEFCFLKVPLQRPFVFGAPNVYNLFPVSIILKSGVSQTLFFRREGRGLRRVPAGKKQGVVRDSKDFSLL